MEAKTAAADGMLVVAEDWILIGRQKEVVGSCGEVEKIVGRERERDGEKEREREQAAGRLYAP